MKVYEDKVSFPNGSEGIYGYVTRSDGAGVVVLNERDEILLIKQYRYPISAYEWNIPGGAIDGEDSKGAAKREVLEETGIQVAETEIEEIATFYPLSSCSSEKYHFFFSRVSADELDSEDISEHDEVVSEKRFIPITKALEMIDNGEITDANTAAAIQIVARKLVK